jgi:hypothetical protein
LGAQKWNEYTDLGDKKWTDYTVLSDKKWTGYMDLGDNYYEKFSVFPFSPTFPFPKILSTMVLVMTRYNLKTF